MVAANPDQLAIWGMRDRAIVRTIPPLPPAAVTVSSDGFSVALTHNGQTTVKLERGG